MGEDYLGTELKRISIFNTGGMEFEEKEYSNLNSNWCSYCFPFLYDVHNQRKKSKIYGKAVPKLHLESDMGRII